MPDDKKTRPAPPITQETVEALQRANTMEEFLAIAVQHNVNWDALGDEWLDAIVQGDVLALMDALKHKPKTGKGKKGAAKRRKL